MTAQVLHAGPDRADRVLPAPPPKIRHRADARVYRGLTIGLLAIAVLAPVGLIVYQSFLDGPFFSPRSKLSLDAYGYVLTDPMFWKALWTTVLFAVGMVVIAVPLGGMLAFLLTRTDIRFKRLLEVLVLVPIPVPGQAQKTADPGRAPQAPWAPGPGWPPAASPPRRWPRARPATRSMSSIRANWTNTTSCCPAAIRARCASWACLRCAN